MRSFLYLSVAEQLAAHLREEILRGTLKDELPGYRLLAKRMVVNHKTMRAALALLEEEGLLVPQGTGRCSLIHLPEDSAPKGFRITILPFERDDRQVSYHRDILDRLDRAGHAVAFADKSLSDLAFNIKRLTRYVSMHPSDAWVVVAGSRAVLEWFAEQPFPVFALAGRSTGLPLAGATIRKTKEMTKAIHKLVELGHRRIVMLVREDRRKPTPGGQEQDFLDTLESQGIQTSSYNLPDWEDNVNGFQDCLGALFGRTPPTALIIDEAPLFVAAEHFLAQRGLSAPKDVSLICTDPNLCFNWCRPAISHCSWQSRALVTRVVRWAEKVACGVEDLHNTSIKAEFFEGGTIGPVPN